MKKIYALTCALAAVANLSAQKIDSNADNAREMISEFKNLSIETNRTPDAPFVSESEMIKQAKAAQAEEETVYQYYYADGMMHGGVSPTAGLYYPVILVPHSDSTVWHSYWKNDVAPSWCLTNSAKTPLAESSYEYVSIYQIGGDYYLPEVGEGTYTDSTNNIKYLAYTYGGPYASRAFLRYGATRETSYPMTLCGMWTSNPGSSSGQDMYSVGAGSNGKYAYGTNLVVSSGRMDTIIQIVEGISPLCIDAVRIPIYGQSTDSIGSMIPEGAKVKLEIFPVEDRTIYMYQPLGTAYFTADDYTPANGYRYTGVINTSFMVDEDGFEVSKSITTTNSFALMITGFNETGCNFGIKSDYFCPKSETTYFKKDGKYSTIWSGGGNNLAISYIGYWPTLTDNWYQDEEVSETWEAPIEGGYATYTDSVVESSIYLYTNTNVIDWEFKCTDEEGKEVEWVTILSDTTGIYTQYNAVAIGYEAEPLPQGVTSRKAYASINVDGISYTRIITQGETTGIKAIAGEAKKSSNEKFFIKNDKLYINKNGMTFDMLGRMVK